MDDIILGPPVNVPSATRSTKADQLTVDLAPPPVVLVMKRQSFSSSADRSGAKRRGGLPCVGACSPPGTA